jgi:Tfp pilus assembly protein PilN
MSRPSAAEILVVGGEPRADLLPPELRQYSKARALRRRLWLGVAALGLVMILGTGAAALQAMQMQSNLKAEQSRTAALVVEQRKYGTVRSVQQEVSLVKAAQQVGTSTEIDWQKYLSEVQTTLPAKVTLTSVTIDAGSPLQVISQATAPLQGARVASLSFAATSATLPQVPAWLDSLTGLPGYADASLGSVTQDGASGAYTVAITMHINEAAFTNRFSTKGK